MPARLRSSRPFALAAAGAAVLAIVLLVVLLVSGGDSRAKPPATEAATLVPADALVFVHVSTDPDRGPNKKAAKIANGFPSYKSLRDQIVARLATTSGSVDFDRDVRPWLGKEAALALINAGSDTAGSLVLIDVRDRKKAEAFVARSAVGGPEGTYKGVTLRQSGSVVTAFIGHFLAVGQKASVQAAIDVRAKNRAPLSEDAVYRRAGEGMPDDRVADAYASGPGVTRLLAPQGGILGLVGTLLTNPALDGAALALVPESPGATIWEHSALDPDKAKARTSPFHPFTPELLDSVPPDAIAYLGITGLDKAIGPLLSLTGSAGSDISTILRRVGQDIDKQTGVNISRDILPLFRGEVALALTPGLPTPVLSVIAHTPDEAKTRAALAKLQKPLAKLLAPAGAGPGAIPQFQSHDAGGGVTAYGLKLGTTLEIDYAVFDGKVVISTGLSGIQEARKGGGLAGSSKFKAVLGDLPPKVTALVFLDFNQLLDLAEATGLNDSPSYQRIRDDLRRVRAVGAVTSVGEAESTAELRFQIP